VDSKDLFTVKALKKAIVNHGLRAPTALLCGLENEVHRPGKVSGIAKEAGSSQQHGCVAIMSTGMHLSGNGARVCKGIALRHGKRIHIGSQANRSRSVPTPLSAANHSNDARSSNTLVDLVHAHHPQRVDHDLSRANLLELQLWVGVNVSSHLREWLETLDKRTVNLAHEKIMS